MQVNMQFAQFAEIILHVRLGQLLNDLFYIFAENAWFAVQNVLNQLIVQLLPVTRVDRFAYLVVQGDNTVVQASA
mgnify:CR=1 FL=1